MRARFARDEGAAAGGGGQSAAASGSLVPAERDARVALGAPYKSGAELYAALKARAGGGAPLSLDDMPDWTGLWTRVGPPLFDPEQKPGELTSAKLKPEPLADLQHRRELSAQGIEYDPLEQLQPAGIPALARDPVPARVHRDAGADLSLLGDDEQSAPRLHGRPRSSARPRTRIRSITATRSASGRARRS